jgi:hypothetical protein
VQDRLTQETLNARKDLPDGTTTYKFTICTVLWSINIGKMKGLIDGALLDRGANGTVIGWNMTMYARTGKYVDLTGLQEHTLSSLNIVHGCCVCMSNLGNVIQHHPQGAHMPDAKSIFSPAQMESYGCKVVDIPSQYNNGIQPYVQSPDGYLFPLAIRHGLFYLDV